MPFGSNQEFSITQVKNSEYWRLNRDVVYFGSQYADKEIRINAATIHDGSSIPRWAWWIVGHPLSGPNGIIGFLHDDICEKKRFPRKICDLIFLEAHKDHGTPLWKRQLMFRAVRVYSIIKGYK